MQPTGANSTSQRASPPTGGVSDVLAREIAYHEKLYGGFAQQHFAKPAVRALREHMVRRILTITGAGKDARVLSLGCGIGDTELLLAPHVGEVVGVDLSPSAVRQANEDARRLGIGNARFVEGGIESAPRAPGGFDAIVAIFLLHHLPDALLDRVPGWIAERLKPEGVFYSLDPSRWRLSGMAGSVLLPKLMAKYQSPDERELDPGATAARFVALGLRCSVNYYDFVSSPLAGLFPAWAAGYRAARLLDEGLVRIPGLRRLGSNFELVARLG